MVAVCRPLYAFVPCYLSYRLPQNTCTTVDASCTSQWGKSVFCLVLYKCLSIDTLVIISMLCWSRMYRQSIGVMLKWTIQCHVLSEFFRHSQLKCLWTSQEILIFSSIISNTVLFNPWGLFKLPFLDNRCILTYSAEQNVFLTSPQGRTEKRDTNRNEYYCIVSIYL